MSVYFVASSTQYLFSAGVAPPAAPPLSIFCWFKQTLNANACCVDVGKNATQLDHNKLGVFNSTGWKAFNDRVDGGLPSRVYSTTTRTLNTWHNELALSTDNLGEIWLDGGGYNSSAVFNPMSGMNWLALGAHWVGLWGFYFTGYIAEVGVWNKLLTAGERASLFSGACPDTVAVGNLKVYLPLKNDWQDKISLVTLTPSGSPPTLTPNDHPISCETGFGPEVQVI